MELLRDNNSRLDSMEYDAGELILRLQKEIENVNVIYDDLWNASTRYNRLIEKLEKEYDDDEWNDDLQKKYDTLCDELEEIDKQINSWDSWMRLAEETHKLLSEARYNLSCLEDDLIL